MNKTTRTLHVRAHPFEYTRAKHSIETAEDYTELILDLMESQGEARLRDIASHLAISHVTALRTLKRLERARFVITSQKKPVQLTKKGVALARYARKRHHLLLEFFKLLGVPAEIAKADVEGVEHHISQTTLAKIVKFIRSFHR